MQAHPSKRPGTIDMLSGLRVCALAAGGFRSGAVTAAGELFTWGYGGGGELGYGDFIDQVVPRRVEALRDACVVAVAAARTRDGSVFGWGLIVELGMPGTAVAVLCPNVGGSVGR
jgi:alpha-tubulin suppressor-like RCC1 family protein